MQSISTKRTHASRRPKARQKQDEEEEVGTFSTSALMVHCSFIVTREYKKGGEGRVDQS